MRLFFELFYLVSTHKLNTALNFELGNNYGTPNHKNITKIIKNGNNDAAMIPLKDISKHFPKEIFP